MKLNQWTIALAAAGVVSLGSVVQAEEAQQHPVLTALSSTTLSGYVDTSAIWKFGTGNANMPGRSYDGAGKQDGFNLDVIKLSLEKPLDEGQWSAGYKADLLFGPDAGTFNALTPGLGFATPNNFAIEQAYVNLRTPVGNGLDFKLGVFDSVIGYESFDAYKDPNFSRSYGYAIDPKQHTGLLATYQLIDWMSVAAGVADSYNGGINVRGVRPFNPGGVAAESEKSYMGLVNITAPESMGALKGASLYLGAVHGLAGGAPFSPTDFTSYYAGATVPLPITGLAIGASYDYRGNTSQGGIPSTYANAVAGYLSYQATEKLKLNNRAEYATGSQGTWGTFGFYANGTPVPEEFFAETFTVDYSLWTNVVSRVEFRWDRDLKGGPPVFGGGPATAFAPRDRNALSLALNLIYRF